MIELKTPGEIDMMRASGKVLASVMRQVSEAIEPGKTTPLDLDALAEQLIREAGGIPSFKGYRGFPGSACISVNEAVIHGIPDDRIFQPGDIVGLDFGVILDDWHSDSAWTFPVGEISDDAKRLLNVTKEALFQGIAKAKAGARVGDISAAVQKYVEKNRYGVVRDLVGHGIGRSLHEEPSVPNFGKAGRGPVLRPGTTICIEPMVTQGTWKVKTLADDWTIVTKDGKLSAHFEHTVAVTADGPQILTQE
jgi:methionyl aminopeptidase